MFFHYKKRDNFTLFKDEFTLKLNILLVNWSSFDKTVLKKMHFNSLHGFLYLLLLMKLEPISLA